MKALIAAVILGGVFGAASATVEQVDSDVMLIAIEVEVSDPADAVVAHLSFEDEELRLPLLDRGSGTFGIRTELEPKNYVVVFETIGEGGESSDPTTLAQMGADLGPDRELTTSTDPDEDEEGLSDESSRLLWLAIALGAASLSLIAFWVLGSRDEDGPTEGETTGNGSSEEE